MERVSELAMVMDHTFLEILEILRNEPDPTKLRGTYEGLRQAQEAFQNAASFCIYDPVKRPRKDEAEESASKRLKQKKVLDGTWRDGLDDSDTAVRSDSPYYQLQSHGCPSEIRGCSSDEELLQPQKKKLCGAGNVTKHARSGCCFDTGVYYSEADGTSESELHCSQVQLGLEVATEAVGKIVADVESGGHVEQLSALRALRHLASDDTCKSLMRSGSALPSVAKCLRGDTAKIRSESLALLSILAESESFRADIISAGLMETVMKMARESSEKESRQHALACIHLLQ